VNYTFNKILFFILLLTLSSNGLISSATAVKIPFVKSDGLMLIKANVDGDDGYLIFDTGADALILNRRADHDAVTFNTVSGTTSMSEHKVEALSIGQFSFEDIDAYAQDLSQLEREPNIKLLGIIGAQLFSSELLHIDNERNVIQVLPRYNLSQLNSDQYISADMRLVDDIIVVPITLSGQSLNFILDSGATTSFVDRSVSEIYGALFEDTSKQSNILTASSTGASCDIVKVSKVKISKLSILDLELAVTDLSKFSDELGIKIDGILSLDQLPIDDVLIDYSASKIYIAL